MFTLRPFEEADFDTLYAIDQSCFDPEIAYSRHELHFFIHRPTAMTIIALDQIEIAGFVIVDLERQKSGHIITIDVGNEYRKQGVGTLLIQAAEEHVRQSKRKSILLEVAVTNSRARRFYEKHGYLELRVMRDYYKTGTDALLMGKNL
jgi:[ribosomal protein S18]-alanine N-acetyltransferase